MEELELTFENEVDVYLPQIVANENKRKANENERIASEEERKINEDTRIANENARKEAMIGYREDIDELKEEANNLIEDLRNSSIEYLKFYTSISVTATDEECSHFALPTNWDNTMFVKVYVNGFKLNANEYIVDTVTRNVVLSNAVDKANTTVEIVAMKLVVAQQKDYATLKGDKGDKGDTGAKGDKGDKGDTGYSPVRGIDYWNDEDILAMETYCNNYINTHFSSIIGDIENDLDTINGEEV